MISSFKIALTTRSIQVLDFVNNSMVFLRKTTLKLKSKRGCHIFRMTLTRLWTFIYYAGYLTQKPRVETATGSSDDVDNNSDSDIPDTDVTDNLGLHTQFRNSVHVPSVTFEIISIAIGSQTQNQERYFVSWYGFWRNGLVRRRVI
ncbi:hypothetical protein PILCRDRAFT_399062 [Piloderma croceum F 1598]|uniref:Uncharacterized protein n=1 Tax=Piloderma croceum (strain F 1598) TaxID=765440 RepID=A0A0C3FIG8_PILCF|nr:hypothetical protein PILCRDRAFT_399062 [Piloderma croceum F 1598]